MSSLIYAREVFLGGIFIFCLGFLISFAPGSSASIYFSLNAAVFAISFFWQEIHGNAKS